MIEQPSQAVQLTVKIGEHEVQLTFPTLILTEDSSDKAYTQTAIPLHLYVIACPSLCGHYAVLTTNGTICPECATSDFPYLVICGTCGKPDCKTNEDGQECYACGEYGSNSDGLMVRGNRKTGKRHEQNTLEEAMERYHEDHLHDGDM